MAVAPNKLPSDLLKDVSRSFYLTLSVLPSSIRRQIGLAYLLARTTDTIADTQAIPVEKRLRALKDLRSRIVGKESDPINLGDLAMGQASPAERTLLNQIETSLVMLQNLSRNDRELTRAVLDTIVSGQELDLERFAEVSPPAETSLQMAGHKLERLPKRIIALQNETELDDYTYRVAGCVGEYWTKMCRAHVFPEAHWDERAMLMNGVRFGKGLQLVNILRDVPEDLRSGRCYLPVDRLADAGLTPQDLLKLTSESKVRPLYNKYLDRAAGHLTAGWIYTNALPWKSWRVRLACAWPILIGMRTIELLRTGKILDPDQRIKITREEVKKIIKRSVFYYPFPNAWRDLNQPVERRAEEEEPAVKN
jgi:farnesyl-diphosphate farnesyltransferase